MTKNFVPVDFVVPTSYQGKRFQLQVLEPAVTELDYEAVMSSKQSLRKIFSNNDCWPSDKMTTKENNNDLVTHLKEFNNREAFAYTVLTPEKNKCIGCIYIEPCNREKFDAECYFWIRNDTLYLETEFYLSVNKWIKDAWPFANIIWPGREISWKVWGKRSHSHTK